MSNLGLLGQSAASRSAIRIIATAPPFAIRQQRLEEFERVALGTPKYLFSGAELAPRTGRLYFEATPI